MEPPVSFLLVEALSNKDQLVDARRVAVPPVIALSINVLLAEVSSQQIKILQSRYHTKDWHNLEPLLGKHPIRVNPSLETPPENNIYKNHNEPQLGTSTWKKIQEAWDPARNLCW